MKNLKITDECHLKLKSYCDFNNIKISEWVSEKILEIIKNDIYVEISPRQTGKTFRLLNAVKSHINSGNKLIPVIVTVNKGMGLIIKERLEYMGINTKDIKFSRTMHIPEETAPESTHRYFVDEFDFIDRDKLFISNNGYYTTTLKYVEGDKFTNELYQMFLNSRLWR